MENNIYNSSIIHSLTVNSSIISSIGNSLKKHFVKIIIVSIFIGAISYILKTSGALSKKDKTANKPTSKTIIVKKSTISNSNKTKAKKDKRLARIKNLKRQLDEYSGAKIGLLKEDYESFIKHVESCAFKDSLKQELEKNIITRRDGNVLFVGNKALSAYSKAIISSGYCKEEHPLKGLDPELMTYLNVDHPLFEELKKFGGPISINEHGYIIFLSEQQNHAKAIAKSHYSSKGLYIRFTEEMFDQFKENLRKRDMSIDTEDLQMIYEIDSNIYIAFPETAAERYTWLANRKPKSEKNN